MFALTVGLLGWVVLAAVPGVVGDSKGGEAKCPEAKMIEYKGKLRHPVYAIGGETTGTVIETAAATYELDLGGKKEWQKLAASLNGKQVVVTGVLKTVKGVEIPERHVITVKDLKAAEEKKK